MMKGLNWFGLIGPKIGGVCVQIYIYGTYNSSYTYHTFSAFMNFTIVDSHIISFHLPPRINIAITV